MPHRVLDTDVSDASAGGVLLKRDKGRRDCHCLREYQARRKSGTRSAKQRELFTILATVGHLSLLDSVEAH